MMHIIYFHNQNREVKTRLFNTQTTAKNRQHIGYDVAIIGAQYVSCKLVLIGRFHMDQIRVGRISKQD